MKPHLSSPAWLLALGLAGGARACFSQNATYPKLEASFNVTGVSTNPAVLFDYTQTDVRVTIVQPDISTVVLPAFYDGGTTWRVRHTPTLAGTYRISGITLNGSAISVGDLQPGSWAVVGPAVDPGFV